jgi:hypothetical protein
LNELSTIIDYVVWKNQFIDREFNYVPDNK